MEILIDARAMMPPEPLAATLDALDRMRADDVVVLWLGRVPQPLLRMLDRDGYQWRADDGPDGCHEYRIRLPGAAALKTAPDAERRES